MPLLATLVLFGLLVKLQLIPDLGELLCQLLLLLFGLNAIAASSANSLALCLEQLSKPVLRYQVLTFSLNCLVLLLINLFLLKISHAEKNQRKMSTSKAQQPSNREI